MSTGDQLISQPAKDDRVIVLIDAASLFYAAASLGIEIDYAKLIPCLVGDRQFLFAYYYTGINPGNKKQQAFLRWMQNHGYRVVAKEISLSADGNRKADLMVEMAVDMLNLASHCDTIVLVSGNGSLTYAVETVMERGVQVDLVALREMTSDALLQLADRYVNLETLKALICKSKANNQPSPD